MLTDLQKKVHIFIEKYIIENDTSPTLSTIALQVGLVNKQQAHEIVISLEKRGTIVRRRKNNRTTRIDIRESFLTKICSDCGRRYVSERAFENAKNILSG